MTETEQDAQIADLQARLKKFEDYFQFKTNPHDGSVGVMTSGRFGVMTEFWMNQPPTQGSAFSAATITDRFAIYGEIDTVSCPDHPSTAIYASCVAPNTFGQQNIGIESHAANGAINVALFLDGQGVLLPPGATLFLIGPNGGPYKQLWP